jgi:hypothetical protein
MRSSLKMSVRRLTSLAGDELHVVNMALILSVAVYALVRALQRHGVPLERGSVGTQAQDVLWFALVCGLLSFATIEILKRIGDLRGRYHLRRVIEWLARASDNKGVSSWAAFRDLERAMGLLYLEGPPRADEARAAPFASVRWLQRAKRDRLLVFSLPIEQLAGQISAAGDAALTSPHEFPALYVTLAGDFGSTDPPQRPEYDIADSDVVQTQRVRASIDQMQITISKRWRRDVQGTAIWVAGLWGIGLAHAAGRARSAEPRYILSALLLGGIFAWIARDLAAAIEGLRRA